VTFDIPSGFASVIGNTGRLATNIVIQPRSTVATLLYSKDNNAVLVLVYIRNVFVVGESLCNGIVK
jgi:hypothetical protein